MIVNVLLLFLNMLLVIYLYKIIKESDTNVSRINFKNFVTILRYLRDENNLIEIDLCKSRYVKIHIKDPLLWKELHLAISNCESKCPMNEHINEK